MSNQFISPNWHPLLIHYPLAFLSAGILIELLGFFWRRGSFRAAGRWMILLGALTSVPAWAAGIYSYRIVIGGGAAEPRMAPWFQAVAQSRLTSEQWHYLACHIWLNSIGVFIVVGAVVTWVSATDALRRTLYWPAMLALLCGMGLFGAGSWFGGEAVYRFATAVELPPAHATTRAPTDVVEQAAPAAHAPPTRGIKWFLPPLELHIVLAGVTLALLFGAMAFTLRRLDRPAIRVESRESITSDNPPCAEAPAGQAIEPEPETASLEPPRPCPDPILPAGRFWLLTCLAALATGIGGLWSAAGAFTPEHLSRNWIEISGARRFLIHTILGTALILLPLILAAAARWGRRRRPMTYFFVVLAVLVIGFQFWLGIAMFYDGHKGPVVGFNTASKPATH